MNWRQVWAHQLRWARTIRACQPAPYFFSILSNATFWPVVWFAVAPSRLSLLGALGCIFLRRLTAAYHYAKLTRSGNLLVPWLAMVKDLLGDHLGAGVSRQPCHLAGRPLSRPARRQIGERSCHRGVPVNSEGARAGRVVLCPPRAC